MLKEIIAIICIWGSSPLIEGLEIQNQEFGYDMETPLRTTNTRALSSNNFCPKGFDQSSREKIFDYCFKTTSGTQVITNNTAGPNENWTMVCTRSTNGNNTLAAVGVVGDNTVRFGVSTKLPEDRSGKNRIAVIKLTVPSKLSYSYDRKITVDGRYVQILFKSNKSSMDKQCPHFNFKIEMPTKNHAKCIFFNPKPVVDSVDTTFFVTGNPIC